MLRQRVITAVILLAILLPALFWPAPAPFAVVVLVLLAAGAWEWGRLNGLGPAASLACGAACLALCALAWQAGWAARPLAGLWIVAGALWVLGGALVLRRGVDGWPRIPRALRVTGGVLALWLAWLALAQARAIGINFLLSVFVLVWAADIAAYFAGRAFGLRWVSRRLAPAISPGKSWEGAWGGMLAVVVVGLVWWQLDAWLLSGAGSGAVSGAVSGVMSGTGAQAAGSASLYSHLAERGPILFVLSLLFLAAMSVAGDLVESLVKRAAGAKDSSGLLPGHGGVLDRVDALLPVLPLAMMLVSL